MTTPEGRTVRQGIFTDVLSATVWPDLRHGAKEKPPVLSTAFSLV
ncbi:hypothetical protein CSC02_1050 [Enterobacter hormaechei subsp. hoffmannii]|nr:hypothetical protein CSC02_1050 [Enterobacter hormaechei subsp. hoffmannii]